MMNDDRDTSVENDDYNNWTPDYETEEIIDEKEQQALPQLEDYAEDIGEEDLLDEANGLLGWQIEYFIRSIPYFEFYVKKIIVIYLTQFMPDSVEPGTLCIIVLPDAGHLNQHWIAALKFPTEDYIVFDSYGQNMIDILNERGGVNSHNAGENVFNSLFDDDAPQFLTVTKKVQNNNTNICGMYIAVYLFLYCKYDADLTKFQHQLDIMFVEKDETTSATQLSMSSFNNDIFCKSLFADNFNIPDTQEFQNVHEILEGKLPHIGHAIKHFLFFCFWLNNIIIIIVKINLATSRIQNQSQSIFKRSQFGSQIVFLNHSIRNAVRHVVRV